ncbi:hypothetical protein QMK17_17565 [Rhodococcus sp. G-MC3]|uniref:AAA family ATPase n=1 Tax=Rhodococcus sp. G-MC3 TaxID=3046209 RepID=UPI0024BA92C1|nr:AAA family ATPase [Rhodococcus sp. G-MC3]MDJ0395136.1 hypothetical protein [Rhodococcus sp. G-MC3]
MTISRSRVGVQRGRNIAPSVSTRSTVDRSRLCATMNSVLIGDADLRIVSITAPAGSGKTVLLSRWIRGVTPPVATAMWLTATEDDNDVQVLRAAIIAAAAASENSALADAAQRLTLSEFAGDRSDLAGLGELLDSSAGLLCLVIDDAHLLRDASALEEMAALLRWAPPSFRLILSGRFEPPLLLSRSRLAGAVAEITAEDIAFTSDESRELLSRHQLDQLTDDVLDTVMSKTEGWAAGLQLAALTALRSTNPRDALSLYAGTDRATSDFLVDEFITSLPPRIRQILIITAIPDAVTNSLAAYLTRIPSTHVVLEALTRNNFLISRTATDQGPLYRYHPLMRAYLRAEAERDDVCTVSDIRRRASLWYIENGQPFDALRHAIDSGDPDTTAAVLEQAAIDLVLGGHSAGAILGLVERAPREVRGYPTTRLITALALLAAGNFAPAAATLVWLGREPHTATAIESALAALLEAQLALHTDVLNDTATATETALRTLHHIDNCGERSDIDASIALHQAATELFLGRLADADRHVVDASAHAHAAHSPVLELHCLGARTVLSAFTGRFDAVTSTAMTAVALTNTHSLGPADTVALIQAYAVYAADLRMDWPPAATTSPGRCSTTPSCLRWRKPAS